MEFSMEFHEIFHKHLTDFFIIFFHGIPWEIQWNSMEFNEIPLNFYGIPWNSSIDGIWWNSILTGYHPPTPFWTLSSLPPFSEFKPPLFSAIYRDKICLLSKSNLAHANTLVKEHVHKFT
jgi:hypothetical protein